MNGARVPYPSEKPVSKTTDQLWDHVISQIDSVIEDQNSLQKVLRRKVLDFFPEVPQTRGRDVAARVSCLREMCEMDFFNSAAEFECVASMATKYFPSQTFGKRMDCFTKDVAQNIFSDCATKYMEGTMGDINNPNSPLNYLMDRIQLDKVAGISGATPGTPPFSPGSATSGGMNYQGGFSSPDHNPNSLMFPTMPGNYQENLAAMGYMPYTLKSFQDTMSGGAWTSNLEDNSLFNSNQSFKGMPSGSFTGSINPITATHAGMIPSTMSAVNALTFWNMAIPIPFVTIGVDLFKEGRLLAKGKTNIFSASGHVAGHAVAVGYGGVVGGAIGTAFAPGVGTLVGAAVGVVIGDKVFKKIKVRKLHEVLSLMDVLSQSTNQLLNQQLDEFEKDFSYSVEEELSRLKHKVDLMTPSDLESEFALDKEIPMLKTEIPEQQGKKLVAVLKSRELRETIADDPEIAGFLIRDILPLIDRQTVELKAWSQAVQCEVRECQSKLVEELRCRLDEIDKAVQDFNQQYTKLKDQANKRAGKLGIKLPID